MTDGLDLLDYVALASLAWKRLALAPVVAVLTVLAVNAVWPAPPPMVLEPRPVDPALTVNILAERDEIQRAMAPLTPDQATWWTAHKEMSRLNDELRRVTMESAPPPIVAGRPRRLVQVTVAGGATFALMLASVYVEAYVRWMLRERSWYARRQSTAALYGRMRRPGREG